MFTENVSTMIHQGLFLETFSRNLDTAIQEEFRKYHLFLQEIFVEF